MPKISVGESFTVALISGTEKVWIRERGEYHDFPSKIFCLTVPKLSVGEHFTVALVSGIKKVWIRERGGGSIKIFRRKFFVSQSRKNSYGEPYSVSLIAGTEKVWIREKGGVSRFSVENFLSHSAEKIRAGNLIVFH